MTGGNAYDLMFFGHKVRLPEWEGYWFRKNGKIWVHLQDGTELEQNDMTWINATVWRNDWEVVKEQSINSNLKRKLKGGIQHVLQFRKRKKF